ncbi:MAG: hypothetical protein E7315_06785 [Clostridiales bacterium]|nr:hypothetical protein [Clostridiales bacterium]
MKNKLIKAILVLFLCIVMLTGCSVVPSSTPTPTPIEPTPTPIPYGEVIDVVIETNDNIFFNWSIAQILLERFSIRLIEYNPSTTSGPDVIVYAEDRRPSYNEGTDTDYSERYARRRWSQNNTNRFGINYLERLKDMPNYSSLLYSKEAVYDLFPDGPEGMRYSLPLTGRETSAYYLWLYNEKWFEKYNYSIPETMEELVDLLIDHKTNVDPSAQPILINKDGREERTMMDTALPHGVFATYGIDYFNELKKVGEGEFNYSTSDPKVIKALDILKKINDNGLASDSCLNYDNISTSDLSECAVFYNSYIEFSDYHIIKMKNDNLNWGVAETQFSYDGTPYVVHGDINYASTALNYFTVNKYAKKEIVNRLLDYIDWCSTEEGMFASYFGFEGTDYKIDENGKLVLLKERSEISPAAMQVVSATHILKVARKYGYTPSSYYPAIDADKNDIKILTQPEIKYASSPEGRDAYEKVVNVSEQFFNDYVNGTKTADDFSEYLADLESAGLSDFLKGAKDYYDELYEEFKDYLPDSLK